MGNDPDNRQPMLWEDIAYEPEETRNRGAGLVEQRGTCVGGRDYRGASRLARVGIELMDYDSVVIGDKASSPVGFNC